MDHSFNKKNIITFDPTPRKSGGGSEKSLLETLKGLKNLGNEIQIGIINPKDYEILDIYKQNGFKIKNIFAVYLKNKSNPFDYIKLYRSQKKFDLKGNDIIYVNGYYDLPLAVILKLINKIPIVCHLRIPPNLSKQYLYSLKFVDKFVAATPKLRDLYIKHAS
ncbi:MAG TPA: glycosyltransferase family 4 protein, partial [Ignavibacteriaceae bacterium]|nr:glycosyltransferase family 4 protein [Ignavibacteriaceae bacterium]